MQEIRQTVVSARRLDRLKDRRGRARILARIDRLGVGHFGDVKSLGSGVAELRIDHGPGYRVYFTRRGSMLVIPLCGGDKGTQTRDIAQAHALAEEIDDDG